MITRMKTIAATTALAAMMTLGAQAAQATTFNPNNITCKTEQFVLSTDCEGPFSGNDSNSDLDGIFTTNGWTEIAKVDGYSGTDGFLTVTSTNSGNTAGTWKWTSTDGWGSLTKVMAVLKGGSSFSAYLVNLSETDGTWSTAGILKGSGDPDPALSHLTLYAAPAVVPLPAAGWLLLMGIGGLGVASRRRRKAQHS